MANEFKQPFHEQVAAKLIEQLQQGTAPWQKPWEPGEPGSFIPMNPITGKRYKGINAIQLMAQGYDDQRWMTYQQAAATGAQVRRGEKGTPIQYWKFTEEQTKTDENGKPVLDSKGQPIKEAVRLERPRVFFATVFNAEQIDGLAPMQRQAHAWNAVERIEQLLQTSGAVIRHSEQDRAFYRLATDSIHLPDRAQFPTANAYFATALHELGHWSGHPSRLGRDLAHPFGSEGYAREELRAEIASLMLGDGLGIGHDPDQHAAYVGSWIKALQNDPLEIFRAAADAEKIQDYVLALEQQQVQEQSTQQTQGQKWNPEKLIQQSVLNNPAEATQQPEQPRQYLAVPYGEHPAAKVAGALWDKVAKSWYAGPQADREQLQRWMPENVQGQQSPAMNPREEFAEVLRRLGCSVSGEHPIMDGKTHRIGAEGDKQGEQAGFYVGHLDGHPAGYVKNNRTGIAMKWKSKGYSLDPEQKARLQAEAAGKLQARAAEREQLHEQTAQRIEQQMADLVPATIPTPYMQAKGIAPQAGVFTDREGKKTYLPAIDSDGKQWTMQYIQEDGLKRFAKHSRKEGCFHPIGGLDAIAKAPVLVIAEGYATAASLSEALGCGTVAAFDSGNLPHVAQALHARFPDKPVIIAGDNDQHLEATQGVNPGKIKAEEAAKAVGGKVMLPIFAPGEQAANPKSFTDFNDLATKSALGRDGIERQARAMVDGAIEKRQAALEQRQRQERAQRQERRPRAIRL